MKTVFEHIEHIKGKPHHIRKSIAFGTAAGGTALIAFVWLVASVSTGRFALKPTSFADIANQQESVEVVGPESSSENLAGVAAALGSKDTTPRIQIVDTASSTRPVKKPEQTTIPF